MMPRDQNYIDLLDIKILETIMYHDNLGTMTLAKKVGIAPKNLIHRVKKAEKFGWLVKEKIKLKPKGWSRVLKLTNIGKQLLTLKFGLIENKVYKKQ